MEIILLERVEKLGQMGQVVDVRPGYARNFLLPQRRAAAATAGNLRALQGFQGQAKKREARERAQAEELARKIADNVESYFDYLESELLAYPWRFRLIAPQRI